jgi:hypothetical protein
VTVQLVPGPAGAVEVVTLALRPAAAAQLHEAARLVLRDARVTGRRRAALVEALAALAAVLPDFPDTDRGWSPGTSGRTDTAAVSVSAGFTGPGTDRPVRRYTTGEAAQLLGMSTRHVQRLAALDGEPTRAGAYRIDPACVAEWAALRGIALEGSTDGHDHRSPGRVPGNRRTNPHQPARAAQRR